MGERKGGTDPCDPPARRSFVRRAWDYLFGARVDHGYKSNVRLQVNNRLEVGIPTKISEEEYQNTTWDAGGTHYNQVSRNTLLTSKIGGWHERGRYQFTLPQNFGGWSQDDTGSDGLIWKGCLSCHSDNGAFNYAVSNSSTAGIGKSVGLLATFLLQTHLFTPAASLERNVINEANNIMSQEKMLNEIFKSGIGKEIKIGSRTIVIEPDAPLSGLTLFEENAFVIGKEAFSSPLELRKTVLHELYRLNTSNMKGLNVTQGAVSTETQSAFNFAEKNAQKIK